MTVVLTEPSEPVVRTSEDAKVASWERDQFARMGFDETRIELLLRERVSWHVVDDLLRGGCEPLLALSIVL